MRKRDLPAMASCTSCGDCCGPVSARPDEQKRIRAYVREHDIEWVPLGDRCGFLRATEEPGKFACAIYPARPWSCRAYGVIIEMRCPYFPDDATLQVPARQAVMLRLVDGGDPLLGELFERGYLERLAGTLVTESEEAAQLVAHWRHIRGDVAPYGRVMEAVR